MAKKIATKIILKNEVTGRWHPDIEVHDHFVLITEPGYAYLGHVTPKNGKGKTIAKSI